MPADLFDDCDLAGLRLLNRVVMVSMFRTRSSDAGVR